MMFLNNIIKLISEKFTMPNDVEHMLDLQSEDIPSFGKYLKDYVFTSCLCREQHFRMPLYSYWCYQIKELPRYHRKQWEFVYILQSLNERQMLTPGKNALGFGVGKEPISAYLSKMGLNVLATDLDFETASQNGWVSSNQRSLSLDDLNDREICDPVNFKKNVSFRNVDMNKIPSDIGEYDVIWSSCCFEHLGSIQNGIDFVLNSSKFLKINGIAIHTTEFNLTSNEKTLDNDPNLVLFRKKDIERLCKSLEENGFLAETVDFSYGSDKLEKYIDVPPYLSSPHLRLLINNQFTTTSIGLIIRRYS
jgi:2-polyprenyl-3-methyl-5-hydroxy-6-metoxy-1,4-benzoquinol methylase